MPIKFKNEQKQIDKNIIGCYTKNVQKRTKWGDSMYPIRIAEFFDVFSQSQKAYSRQLDPVCKKWDLTRSEVDVLLFLYNNPEYDRAADIVSRRGMTKSHVSMSVANLTDRGLLAGKISPDDRRTTKLRLLEEGMKIAAEAREAQQEFFDRIYEGLSPEELEIWENITQKVVENIGNFNK